MTTNPQPQASPDYTAIATSPIVGDNPGADPAPGASTALEVRA